jgi:hypothetical protein
VIAASREHSLALAAGHSAFAQSPFRVLLFFIVAWRLLLYINNASPAGVRFSQQQLCGATGGRHFFGGWMIAWRKRP